jgi:putative two-component system response regulator
MDKNILRKKGILIVDDELAFVETLKLSLEQEGFDNIISTTNPIEAISILANDDGNINLVLSDIVMPQMNGIAFLNHVINVHKHVVGFIGITAFYGPEIMKEYLDIKSENIFTSDFISKPFEFEDLVNSVYKTLELIQFKRSSNIDEFSSILSKKIDEIIKQLKPIEKVENIEKQIIAIQRKQKTFLEDLGLDLIRTIIIALAILSILYFGIGNLIKNILGL